MLGKAMDFYIPGVSLKKLRNIGLRMQAGGVGYYPRSGSPFVHMDVGNVRHWPRMSRRELVAVFPSGKTLHVPSDGKPLPGFEQAVASYKSRQRQRQSGARQRQPQRREGPRPAGRLLRRRRGRGRRYREAARPWLPLRRRNRRRRSALRRSSAAAQTAASQKPTEKPAPNIRIVPPELAHAGRDSGLQQAEEPAEQTPETDHSGAAAPWRPGSGSCAASAGRRRSSSPRTFRSRSRRRRVWPRRPGAGNRLHWAFRCRRIGRTTRRRLKLPRVAMRSRRCLPWRSRSRSDAAADIPMPSSRPRRRRCPAHARIVAPIAAGPDDLRRKPLRRRLRLPAPAERTGRPRSVRHSAVDAVGVPGKAAPAAKVAVSPPHRRALC